MFEMYNLESIKYDIGKQIKICGNLPHVQKWPFPHVKQPTNQTTKELTEAGDVP